MDIREAQNIVKTLAQGVDPATGEVFEPESPYNEPRVIRALFTVYSFVRRAKKPKMTIDERRRFNLDRGMPRNAGLPWSVEGRTGVAAGFRDGRTIDELATDLERSPGAIQAELVRQGLISPDLQPRDQEF